MEVKNKNILVTGGASGIGKNIVEKLVKSGAVVGVLDLKQIDNVHFYKCDVTDFKAVEKAITEFEDKVGNVDILINNAGIAIDGLLLNLAAGFEKHDIGSWKKVIDTNLNSIFYVTRVVVEKMAKKRTKGLVVNISSICSSGNVGQSAYSAAKAGVNALTVTWAKELGALGIRVAGLAPGFTDAGITLKMEENHRKQWIKKTPLARLALAEEITGGVMYIINNDFFNGRVLQIDGGLRI